MFSKHFFNNMDERQVNENKQKLKIGVLIKKNLNKSK